MRGVMLALTQMFGFSVAFLQGLVSLPRARAVRLRHFAAIQVVLAEQRFG